MVVISKQSLSQGTFGGTFSFEEAIWDGTASIVGLSVSLRGSHVYAIECGFLATCMECGFLNVLVYGKTIEFGVCVCAGSCTALSPYHHLWATASFQYTQLVVVPPKHGVSNSPYERSTLCQSAMVR